MPEQTAKKMTDKNNTGSVGGVPVRLDVYVAECEGVTRSAAQRLIESGCVTVGGRVRDKKYLVTDADEVTVELPEPQPCEAQPQDIPLDIVYEDDLLLVVNKPKGMVVHPAAGNPDGTLVNALLYHCGGSLSGIGGVLRPGIVHRIDKDTSGLLLVAKTDEAHNFLAQQFASHKLGRIYSTIVVGNLRDDEGTIDAPIARHPVDRKRMAVVTGGKEAITHYTVRARFPGSADRQAFTQLDVRLETGRTHQIRVHMSHIGHPVLGDTVYGGDRTALARRYASVLRGQCLHARTIEFEHPRTHEIMHFDSGLTDYFMQLPFDVVQ